MSEASSNIAVDTYLETQLTTLQTQAKDEGTVRQSGAQNKWMRPELFETGGDPKDWRDIADIFSSDATNQVVIDAIKDVNNPGTTGDLVIANLETDYLATMERAYRLRLTMSWPRAVAHACGRKLGHGHANGPLMRGLEYLRNLVAQANAQTPSTGT